MALIENTDIFGWILNLLGGGSLGFGGGLLYALRFENRPSRTGQAKLGRPSSTWPFWDRSFHLDGPHKKAPNPHFNAEYGPLKWLNHTDVPDWLYRLGNTYLLVIVRKTAVYGVRKRSFRMLKRPLQHSIVAERRQQHASAGACEAINEL